MLVENEEKLKDWIISDITPLCDAEPDALAKYVVALLKKDIDMGALKNFCIDQLDVFLQSQTVEFVNRLFQKLTDKTYIELKKSAGESPKKEKNTEIFVPEESEPKIELENTNLAKKSHRSGSESEKNSQESRNSNSQESRKPENNRPQQAASKDKEKPVRRRISPPPGAVKELETKPARGRSPRGERERKRIEPPSPLRAGRRHERRKSRSRSRSPYDRFERERNRENRLDIDKRFRCRDFDERGFCMRGDKCPYDHGPDPVVVEESAMEKMVQMKTATGSSGFNINVSTAYSALNPPPPGVDNIYSNASGLSTISEGYNPEAPSINAPATVANIDFSVPPPPLPQRMPFGAPGSVSVASNLPPQQSAYDPIGQQHQQNFQGHTLQHQPHIGGHRGGFRGRGRGGRFGGVHRPPAINKSLQVKKIPLELNNIASLNEHFGKFGNVTNIQLQFDGAPDSALVTFSTRQEAQAAFRSTEPILNNRFVKVFWHNPAPVVTTTAPEVTEAKPVVKHSPPAGTVPVLTKRRGATSKAYVAQDKLEADGDSPVNSTGSSKKPEDALLNPTITAARINRNKKIDREKKLRLLDVHRRKTELYKKQMEQQKLLLEKIQKAENAETKKKLYTLFKTLDTSSTTLKKELEDLWEEIQAITRAEPPALGGFSSNGAAKKRKRADTDDLEDDEVPRKVQTGRKSDTVEIEPFMRVLNVLGCDPQYQDDLIFHMEKYGDLFDMEFLAKGRKAIFHYKNIDSAKKAFEEAPKSFDKCPVTVEWAPHSKIEGSIIVPDEHRKPDERVTPKALLASLGEDEDESDRSDHEPEHVEEEATIENKKELVFDDLDE